MKPSSRYFILYTICFICNSCGLEVISTLSEPNISYLDATLVTSTSLSLIHNTASYDGTDFQGYEVYYKIYSGSGFSEFSRLISDRDVLALSPSINRLTAILGYSRLTNSQDNSASSARLVEDLLISSLPLNARITIDFGPILQLNTPLNTQPLFLVNGSLASRPYLYRTSSLSGTQNQSFGSLKTAVRKEIDMHSWTKDNQYEVNMFIVAYGFTPALEPIYSKPVPWGVIRTIR